MKLIEISYPHTFKQDDLPPTICAIGFFDGIHRGHQNVIETAVTKAQQEKMESAVITFHPHPSVVLKKGQQHVKYITPLKEKKAILQQLNVDRVYVITFNKELSSLLPEEFINHFIIGLNIRHVIAGFDYTYGYKGQGNMENISQYSKGFFTHTTIPKIEHDNEKISSTKIRQLMAEGKIKDINTLLGRPFRTTGTVIKGDQRGRTIGYPTANIDVHKDALLPAPGVYAVKVSIKDETYKGMANLGMRPTFQTNQQEPTLEVHMLDFNDNIYGAEIIIDWLTFIRKEQKFDSVEELIEQLRIDEQHIRRFFINNKK